MPFTALKLVTAVAIKPPTAVLQLTSCRLRHWNQLLAAEREEVEGIAIDLMPFTALKQSKVSQRWIINAIAIDLMPFTALKQEVSLDDMSEDMLLQLTSCRLRHWNNVHPTRPRPLTSALQLTSCRLRHWNSNHRLLPYPDHHCNWPHAVYGIETLVSLQVRAEGYDIAIDLMPFTALKLASIPRLVHTICHCNWPHAVYGIETWGGCNLPWPYQHCNWPHAVYGIETRDQPGAFSIASCIAIDLMPFTALKLVCTPFSVATIGSLQLTSCRLRHWNLYTLCNSSRVVAALQLTSCRLRHWNNAAWDREVPFERIAIDLMPFTALKLGIVSLSPTSFTLQLTSCRLRHWNKISTYLNIMSTLQLTSCRLRHWNLRTHRAFTSFIRYCNWPHAVYGIETEHGRMSQRSRRDCNWPHAVYGIETPDDRLSGSNHRIAIDLMPFTALKLSIIEAEHWIRCIAIDLMPFTALKREGHAFTVFEAPHCNWPHVVYGIETKSLRKHHSQCSNYCNWPHAVYGIETW